LVELVVFTQSIADEIIAMMIARATDKHEVTRCAAFWPLLANLDNEIALLDRRGRDQRRIATSPRLAAEQPGSPSPRRPDRLTLS
jgi:hypothetical protein